MNSIEKRAQDLLMQAHIHRPFVDVEYLLSFLGIELNKKPFEDDLSGALIRSKSHVVVAVNENDPANRQRFTIAHEIGHFYLKHDGDFFVDQFSLNKRDKKSQLAIDFKEIEANKFAANLLMPRRMILQAINELVECPYCDSTDTLIQKLAEIFAVSKEAMNFRLINLGIIRNT